MPTGNLKPLVQQIRQELEEIDRERIEKDADGLFELQSMELELKFTVEESSASKGGFDIKVVSAGVDATQCE